MKTKAYIAIVALSLAAGSAFADWYSDGWNNIGRNVLKNIREQDSYSNACRRGNAQACARLEGSINKGMRTARGLGVINGIMGVYNKRQNINPDPDPGVAPGGSSSWGLGGGLSRDGH